MTRVVLLTCALIATALPAVAQGRLFVGGDLFADAKRFSGDPSTNTLDGTAFGGGAEVGVVLNDHFSLRVRVGVGGKTTTSTPIPIGVLALPVGATAPISAFRSQVASRLISTDALFGYQFAVRERVHIGAVGGLSFIHMTRDFSTTGPVALPQVDAAAAALVVRPYTLIDKVPAATVGGEVAVDLTRRLAAVGRMEAHAFSLSSGGPSGFAIRPGAGVRWTF
jgi:hypothetical protein